MGSKKKNAAKNSSVHQTAKVPTPKKGEKTSNGLKQKSGGNGDSKPKKSSKASSNTRWVAILLLSGVVAAVAVFYASPEVQQAVNELIIKYTDVDLLNPAGSVGRQESVDNDPADSNSEDASHAGDKERREQQADSDDATLQKSEIKVEDTKEEAEAEAEKSKLKDSTNQQKSSPVRDDEKKPVQPSSKKKEDKKVSQKDSVKNPEAKKKDQHSKGETQRDEEKRKADRTKQEGTDKDPPARGSSKMEKQKEEVYAKNDITNSADHKIRKQLDEIDDRLERNQLEEALSQYDRILDKHPNSPRALYGRATTLDKLSELRQSNEILEMSLQAYDKVLHEDNVPDKLFKKVGRRLAARQQFRGYSLKASKTYELLTKKFPTDLTLLNELGVSYLMVGQNNNAKQVFKQVLKENPRDGFAMVHLGFILKTSERNPVEAVPYLERGILSRAEGTKDGRFYYHLGDALQRLGNTEKAYKFYSEAASLGLFLSAHQRSLYNVNHLQSHPWWTPQETKHSADLQNLKKHWKKIRDEALAQMDAESGLFLTEDENLRERGDWKQFTLFQQGRKNKKNCEKMPLTCSLVEKIPDASGCKRGQVKFSVMQPGVHVWPHCGPTNCRIRAHLGLIVPEGPRIRVVNETRKWKEGEFIIFDDSFEHEVWHDGNEQRLVLIIDFWHPDLSENQKWNLTPI